MRGELLDGGLSAVAVGQGPPLVLLPGFGRSWTRPADPWRGTRACA
jgi:hypothetical protein